MVFVFEFSLALPAGELRGLAAACDHTRDPTQSTPSHSPLAAIAAMAATAALREAAAAAVAAVSAYTPAAHVVARRVAAARAFLTVLSPPLHLLKRSH